MSILNPISHHWNWHGADWKQLIEDSVVDIRALSNRFPVDREALEAVVDRYPMRINPYVMSLIQSVDDPLGRQVIPRTEEILPSTLGPDPSGEAKQSPAACIVHRYPDRVIFLVSRQCAVFCRFCFRKHGVGFRSVPAESDLTDALDYIRGNRSIEEVILSGGDPLMLSDERIEDILSRLRRIKHVQVIRIHSRMPGMLPQRITPRLVSLLKGFHPLYLITHFNHPAELTDSAAWACARLTDAGIPVGSQSVLLKGVNDTPKVMAELMKGLVRMRVRPYYLHHADPVRGTAHFRLPLHVGRELMAGLTGHISGLCVPRYVVEMPNGGGKVAVLEDGEREARGGNGSENDRGDGSFMPTPDPNRS